MAEKLRFLHIEDDQLDAEQIESMLRAQWPDCGYALICSQKDLQDALSGGACDLVLADFSLPGFDGMAAMSIVKQQSPETPFVFVTGTMGEDTAIETLKNGATDYVLKTNLSRLIPSIERALRESEAATIRQNLEKQIVQASKEWKSTFDAIKDSVALIDSEHKIIRCNQSTCQKLQLDFSEISNQYCWKLFHGSDGPLPDCPLSKAKISHNSETVTIQQDDKWLEIKVDPILSDLGVLTGAVHVVRDVTEKKHAEQKRLLLEQQFHQAQKLESLGVLAGGIAHDFNNILTVIISNCSLLQKRPHMLEELVPEIEAAAQRAADLCRQMLVYAGKAQPVPTHINVAALTGEMVKLLKASIPQNVVISLDLAADIPSIIADASQIRQVVMNLIINASEAIGTAQGCVRIVLETSEIRAGQPVIDHLGSPITPGSYICLEVTDNGCGMNEENMRRIFEPFFSTKFAGRGLGMSAILGIIVAHHGALQLFSQSGHGTTFKVYLPVRTDVSTKEESSQNQSSTPWQGSGTILLVEDEPQLIQIGKMLLEELGFAVIEAANGQEALELYRKNAESITLVVTDIGMPVMDGYQLFNNLKALNPELPIIISSGYGDAQSSSRIKAGEVSGYLNKPYKFDELQEVLMSAFKR